MLRNAGHLLALRHFVAGRNGCRTTSKTFSTSQRTNFAMAAPLDSSSVERENKIRWTSRYEEKLMKQKMEDLLDSLRRERPNPSRTWGCYVDVLQTVGLERIPIEVHRSTLRKCLPDTKQLRIATARRMQARNFPKRPHIFEDRIVEVMKNIRSAGGSLDLDDYHFILEQYAAVGHYNGAFNILKDMEQAHMETRAQSYGLCLRSIAHRLSLPYPSDEELRIRSECSDVSTEILSRMAASGKKITPVILDFTLRILKDTKDTNSFEALLKSAYGIDLSYPDHHALEEGPSKSYYPISTSTLTTIVDFFGRENSMSKMVLAFEVLSNPLPQNSAVYDEEEEDYVPSISTPPLPTAQPNISTYIAMIRSCALNRNAVLARHYVLEAIDKERAQDDQLRLDLAQTATAEVRNPTVSVNRALLLPVLGLANRSGDASLMRWLMAANRRAFRRKREDIEFYTSLLEKEHPSPQSASQGEESQLSNLNLNLETEAPPTTFFTPNTVDESSTIHALDVDLESAAPPPVHQPFDLKFHVHLLQTDLYDLRALDTVIAKCYDRLCNRTREMLDRRVERGQGIYLRHEKGRVRVDEAKWKEIRDSVPRISQRTSKPNVEPQS
ncbi:hypothetical protein SCHPADRAFT_396853 [Schizopora paradoxa]|uniref:Pentacotripeptide-repeat region of PRORP domain-containing protein n=1 Tax=Schizopora paradoxa TaxID=27342 RepID=A0A0H2S7G7_9AGAM|nr:hypothetical protein SCHPADRAFT_396853 [Schizopora paradoxa]